MLLSDRGTMGGRPSRGRALRIVLFKAGVHAVLFFRVYGFLHRKGLRFLPELMSRINYVLTGAEIDPGAIIGGALRMPHPAGVVIGRGVKVGHNVSILSGVVLGGSGAGIISPGKADGYPEVGDDCWLFAGAKVLGPIKVGRGSLVGANAVLAQSVPPDSVVTATPAVIRQRAPGGQAESGTEPTPAEIDYLRGKISGLEERITEFEDLVKEGGLKKIRESKAGSEEGGVGSGQDGQDE